jgi:predicted aldo/keto reductase-like oxidoreductase
MIDGRIHYLGFSFHDRYEVFQEIIDAYDEWTLCLILYNYMDEEFQAGKRGLEYAVDKGLAVTVMEPLRGGNLAVSPPPSIQALWDAAPRQRTPADWALQWVWNHPQVSVALSGMSSMEQVKQNIASADRSDPGTLTEDELILIAQVRDKYRELFPIRCSDCKYCQPCPSGVDIPNIFGIYNEAIAFDDQEKARWRYGWLAEEQRANLCTQCGQCVELCPQQLEIPEWLAKAHELLKEPENS